MTSVFRGHVDGRVGNVIPVHVRVQTRVFGTLPEILEVPLSGSGSGASVHFSGTLLFPGLRTGERLIRHVSLPPRAELLASDGTPLARGPDRTSPIPDVAAEITGTLGPIAAADEPSYSARGFPANAKVGLNGLERIFQDQLAGEPGGTLLAGRRVLARTAPVPGHASPPPSIPPSSAPRSRRWRAATPESPRWIPAPGACSPSPAWPSQRCSRPVRR